MSYITIEDILETERLLGKPVERSVEIPLTEKELRRIRSSQRNGRAHDITVFIFNGNKLLFIAKPFYPSGLFRAPSGGAYPGEKLVEAAHREIYEETGVIIRLEKYFLRIKVRFAADNDCIDWTSHVFKARYVSGIINPIDTNEIREARFVERSELEKFDDILIKINTGGFRYRSFLTRAAMDILDNDKQ
ncbi:MAG: NUDIX hydrolase [candidate division Zixibacteria bacterium]|nr:NUDIX hydrolase [candidate division Zixibacteria bacterium]